MIKHLALALALTACLVAPNESTDTQDLCAIWDQEAGTCPTLATTTDGKADQWAAANYPGVAYEKTGLSCTYGPAVTSCKIHVHVTPMVAVTLACAQQNNGAGFNCTVAVEQ
jgi:hypothetical protein